MPTNDVDAEQQAGAEMDALAADREEQLGDLVPPAREPLEPATLNSLSAVVTEAVAGLSSGQMEHTFSEVTEPQERVPLELAKFILQIAAFVQSGKPAEVSRYQFDPIELMQSNQGLDEIQAIIGTMGRDRKLIKALNAPVKDKGAKPQPGRAPEEEAAPEPAPGE